MMCNAKTLLKSGLALLALGAVLFSAVPEFRIWIITSGPFLLFLLCPLHMLYCMLTMKKKPAEESQANPSVLTAPRQLDA